MKHRYTVDEMLDAAEAVRYGRCCGDSIACERCRVDIEREAMLRQAASQARVLTEAREIARKAMGLTAEEVADVETVGLVGSLASHLELAEQEIDNRGQREAEAQQRIARLETAIDNNIGVKLSMGRLHLNIAGFIVAVEADPCRDPFFAESIWTGKDLHDAVRLIKAALAASPTGTAREE